jgi:hypothetical protein
VEAAEVVKLLREIHVLAQLLASTIGDDVPPLRLAECVRTAWAIHQEVGRLHYRATGEPVKLN